MPYKDPLAQKEYWRNRRLRLRDQISALAKARYAANREKIIAKARAYYQENKEAVRATSKIYRTKNADSIRLKRSSAYKVNPQPAKERAAEWAKKNRERCNEHGARWAKKNVGAVLARGAAYRCMRDKAMPKWADRSEIKKIYDTATQLTKETGVHYEVDHIWPIRGIDFTGLHVQWNLAVVTRAENRSKGNRTPCQQ